MTNPEKDELDTRRSRLSAAKQALLARRLQGSDKGAVPVTIPRRDPGKAVPLSFPQQRLWFLQRLDPADPSYNIPMAYRIDGHLDVPALERSLEGVVRRHEALRTTFVVEGDTPVQVVGPPPRVRLELVDLAGEGEERALAYAAMDGAEPFDLSHGPLYRVRLFRIDAGAHVLVITVHHIVFDGWSVGILLSELARGYAAERGEASAPEPPRVQFGDYALWQRERLRGEELDAEVRYWKGALSGSSGVLEIPRETIVAAGPRRGGEVRVVYPLTLLAALRKVGAAQGATPFMTLASALGIFLRKLTGEEDILVGTPVAGRTAWETEQLIGFFVNTVVLRIDMAGDPSFVELLSRVRSAALGALAHQEMPFDRLVEEIQPPRVAGQSPLIQVMFALQNAPSSPPAFPGLDIRGLSVSRGTAKFDLTVTAIEDDRGLDVSFEYNAAILTRATVGGYARAFKSLLEQIVHNPGSTVSGLSLMAPEETREVLGALNPARPPGQPPIPVHVLVERQARTRPGAPAVSCGGGRYTYAQLNARANQIARMIPGGDAVGAVGVCVRRSAEMIPALLGILKAGGTYVPLDPAYPAERLAAMARDARLSLVLTTGDLAGLFPDFGLLRLDESAAEIGAQPAADPPATSDPARLAYIMFTSGSTGTPKGVGVTHGALAGHIATCSAAYGIGPEDTVLQFASSSFDPSIEQVFTALCAGAHLVVRGEDVWSAGELAARIDQDALTVVNLPTAYWREVARALPVSRTGEDKGPLRLVIVGGEAMTCDALDTWRKTRFGRARILNAYGPTEATVTAFLFDCTSYPTDGIPPSSRVPIGRALPDRWVCVCDEGGNPLPPGIPGELCIGGPSLALGYVNNPEQTAAKFVPNRAGGGAPPVLYRTGDIVRVLPDGQFEFLRRIDDQAKVRGYRVEPGEIASALKQHPSVTDAVAVIRKNSSGEGSIIAYAASGATTAAELHAFLEGRLPSYMVPRSIVVLGQIPLLPSGKVDWRALPEPSEEGRGGATEYVAPRDALERDLASLWEALLGKTPVGVRDDFFALGGHSLLAARLFAQIERLTGKNLPLATLFRAPTIEGLASVIREGGKAQWHSLVAIREEGTRPPFYCIHALGGNVIGYTDLAAALPQNQPVYGLQAVGLDGSSHPAQTVEEMAAQYVKEIRDFQPSGPYYLGGACTGGIVAYEMAQQLVRQGHEVGVLAMFDTFASGYLKTLPRERVRTFRRRTLEDRIRYHVSRLVLHPDRIAYVRKKLVTLHRRVNTWAWAFAYRHYRKRNQDLPAALRNVEQYHTYAIRAYVPKPYPGRLELFSPISRSIGEFEDRRQGWGALALGGVDVIDVEGDHLTMLAAPYVRCVADILSRRLEEEYLTHAPGRGTG